MVCALNVYPATFWLIVLLILNVESLIKRRYFHDGILYEDWSPDGRNVQYSSSVGFWHDLDRLVEHANLTKKAMFCSRGVGIWLLYPETFYSYGIKSRELTVSFGEKCLPVDHVKSIQPLGTLNFKVSEINAVIGFSEKYFAARGILSEGQAQDMKSVIFVGEGMWTVSGGSKPLCVTSTATPGSICLVEDTETAFGGTSLTITEGCEGHDQEEEHYGLLSCYSETLGTTKIVYAFDFLLPSMQKVCGGGYESSDDTKDKFLHVMDVIDKRIHNELSLARLVDKSIEINDTAIQLNMLRSSILMKIFKIMASCSAADVSFLEIVMYIFKKMHLKSGKIWGEGPNENSTEFEKAADQLDNANNFLKNCLKGKGSNPVYHIGCTPMHITSMKNRIEVEAIEDFLTGESFDFIVEQIWLMMNYANAYCNTIVGHTGNEWIDFPLVIKKEFMNVVKDQWLNPGRWAHYYPLMFNGFDLSYQKKQMIACLQKAIIASPSFDPISRPPEFELDANATILKEALGKSEAPAGDKPVPAEGARAKRQHDTSEAKLIAENKVGPDTTKKQDVPQSSSTTKPPLITSTSSKSPPVLSSSSTPAPESTTVPPETLKPKPKGKKHGKKERKSKRGKTKKNRKRSKLFRKGKEENAEEQSEGVTENIL